MFKKTFIVISTLALAIASAHAAKDGWLLNFDEAVAKAKAEDKIILIEFHGSDWCPPCIKLNDEVLTTKSFKDLAEAELVLVDADFPRRTKLSEEQTAHNEKLARQFGIQGFPTVILLDTEGNVLDKMVGFPRGGLKGFMSFIEAKTGSDS